MYFQFGNSIYYIQDFLCAVHTQHSIRREFYMYALDIRFAMPPLMSNAWCFFLQEKNMHKISLKFSTHEFYEKEPVIWMRVSAGL